MREHGTRAKYVVEKCRCNDCRAANAEYNRQAKRRVVPATVNAARARLHIAELRAAGMGTRKIAEASGVGRTAIVKIVERKVTSIRPATEQAILGVTLADCADRQLIDATRTWQQITDLLEAGWTKAAIGQAIGQDGRRLQLGETHVTAANARAIADLHSGLNADDLPANYPDHPHLWEGDTRWIARAACKTSEVPTWLFFSGPGDTRTVDAAKAVCAGCGVQAECLEYALRNHADGVWGGTSGKERILMRRMAVAS